MLKTRNHHFHSKSILFSMALLMCSAFLHAQDYNIRIACIGNSITYGSHLNNPAEECYPSQLRSMLYDAFGDTCTINNYGLSGRNMLRNGPNPIWNEQKFNDALNWTPDICVILLGTNDSRPLLWEKYGDEFYSDYVAMIDVFKHRNPNTRFILGIPTPIWEGHPYGGDTYEEKHNDSILVNFIIPEINKVAKTTNITLIDFYTPFMDNVERFPDRLHPDSTGAGIMAQMIFNTIIEEDMIHEIMDFKEDMIRNTSSPKE